MTDAVQVSRAHKGIGGSTFKRVTIGDQSIKLVRLADDMWLAETWDDNVRLPQVERSGKAGVWTSESAALFRAIEHVYEHSAMASEAHAVAASHMLRTDWGRR